MFVVVSIGIAARAVNGTAHAVVTGVASGHKLWVELFVPKTFEFFPDSFRTTSA